MSSFLPVAAASRQVARYTAPSVGEPIMLLEMPPATIHALWAPISLARSRDEHEARGRSDGEESCTASAEGTRGTGMQPVHPTPLQFQEPFITNCIPSCLPMDWTSRTHSLAASAKWSSRADTASR
eukprot:scaffold19260_cov32-Tisochrysis_lutea.AAC.2